VPRRVRFDSSMGCLNLDLPIRYWHGRELLYWQTNPIELQSGTVRLLARVQGTSPIAKTMILPYSAN